MIVYTCPECGKDLRFSDILTYPPIHVAECPACGWKEEKMDKIERIPYKTNTEQEMQHDQMVDDYLLKNELCSKADMIAILTELRQDVDMMSDVVIEDRSVTITSWGGMQKKICELIQSKINELKGE